ncbi:MAG TPA: tetratricopeptide repeat protein [Thermoanaerobaculia bacterium]|nr:tetratricopeptide repeat protein [Thermoanaerobaculia bacterium]
MQHDLSARLGSGIRYEIDLQAFIPYNVSVRYIDGCYLLTICLGIGFDEKEYRSTVDYIIGFIGDHQEELQYQESSSRDDLSSQEEHSGPAAVPRREESGALPNSSTEWNNRGYDLAERGRWEEAIPYYRRALALDPQHTLAWSNLGNALLETGHPVEALNCQERALALDPTFALGWANKAVVLAGLGRREEALPCYDQALELDPFNPMTWFSKGSTLAILGRHEAALHCFDHILTRLDSRMKNAFGAKSEMLRQLGRREEALQALDELLSLDPLDAHGHAYKGALLLDLERPAEALKALDRSLAIQPGQSRTLSHKGRALHLLHQPAQAIAFYDRALDIEPGLSTTLLHKAAALEALGQLEEALACYGRAHQLGHPDAARAIAAYQERLSSGDDLGGEATPTGTIANWFEASQDDDAGAVDFCRELFHWLDTHSAFDDLMRHAQVTESQARQWVQEILDDLSAGAMQPAKSVVHNAIAWRLTGQWLVDDPGFASGLSESLLEVYRGLAYAVTTFASAAPRVEHVRDLSQAFFDLLWSNRPMFVSLTPQNRLFLKPVLAIRDAITEVRLEERKETAVLSLSQGGSRLCEVEALRQHWLDLYLCLRLESHFRIPVSQRFRLGQSELSIRFKIGAILDIGPYALHVGGESESFFFDELAEFLRRYAVAHWRDTRHLLARLDVLLTWMKGQLSTEIVASAAELKHAGVGDRAWAALQSVGIAITFEPKQSALGRLVARLREAGQAVRTELSTALS